MRDTYSVKGGEAASTFASEIRSAFRLGLSTVPYTGYGRIETGSIRARGTRNRNRTVVGKIVDGTGRGSIRPYTGSYGVIQVRS